MKLTLLLSLLLLNLTGLFAQQQAAIWYFGENAGLDFRSGSPVALTDGQLNTREGTATISDDEGNLLFYSDGTSVWNKDHQIMVNGEGLLGNITSSQSAIIIPKPSSTNIFYIFTVSGNAGLHFSEIDMDLENGLGAITDIKNVPLVLNTTEKVTAVMHSNGEDIWVITHEAGNNSFLAYMVTSGGVITTPVKSSVGIDLGEDIKLGYMKASPDGTKLALAHWRVGTELLDFDTSSGRVSNPLTLVRSNEQHYGIEFSPSGHILYRTIEGGKLVQYDLLADDIPASATLIYEAPSRFIAALQLGIDGKIYVAGKKKNLDVINDPDVPGLRCNFQTDAVSLKNRRSLWGLPPFIQSYFDIDKISAENFCRGENTYFSVDGSGTVQEFLWEFGDGTTSTDENPTHKYGSTGNYTVKVALTTNGRTVTETKEITIYENPVAHEIEELGICSNESSFTLDLTTIDAEVLGSQSEEDFSVHYFSSLSNAENNHDPLPASFSVTRTEETIYARVVNRENPECIYITDFKVMLNEIPVLNDVNDWMVCDNGTGSYTFDLSEKTSEVLDGQDENSFSVSWFENRTDAEEDQNSVPSEYTSSSTEQEIFFRIHNNSNPDCYQVGNFQLQILSEVTAHTPTDHVICDDETNADEFSFDLSTKDSEVLGAQDPGIHSVSYYTSESDAINGDNPLPKNSYSYTAPGEEIFVRVDSSNPGSCYSINSFFLVVNTPPEPKIISEQVLCPDTPHLELDGGDFDSWEWLDENGNLISTARYFSISEPGNYHLTVGRTKSSVTCQSSTSFEVLSSQTATNFEFVTQHFKHENRVEIFVEDAGDFEYSLDGKSFQENNAFYVSPGVYKAYVRDILQCRTLQKEIVVLGKMEFFTPNGDGHNDNWKLTETGNFDKYVVFIFDRYGKLLKQLKPSEGWDGTFNGKPMPSDDYWFAIEMEEGKTYKGHFTLKR